MEDQKQKINPYAIVIVVMALIIAGLLYNQWGKGFLPASVEEPEKGTETETEKESTSQSPDLSKVDAGVTEDDIYIGNKDAPVTIVEYYSYLCSYCERFDTETKPQIINNYVENGKVKFVFRPYPPYELGMAVLCADDQGKFFQYHNALFEKSQEIEKMEDLTTIAKNVGLNSQKFAECFQSQKYKDKVEYFYKAGEKTFAEAGVPENQRGTPAFSINGELLVGAQPYDKFIEAIEKKLGE